MPFFTIMAKWVVAAKRADFKELALQLNIDPVLVRILRNRDLITEEEMREFLYGDESSMHNPLLLNDMEKAVSIVTEAVNTKKHIRIIGDYDVDGVTSTFILVKGLRSIGANVDYAIPNRIRDGYGINEHLIDCAFEDNVDLIITCDNGIAATDALKKAKELGIACIVTDHHEVPYIIEENLIKYIYPEAEAIINPKRHDSTYPFKGICGAMVAYKLIVAISSVVAVDYAILSELREMAGLGTVCDVMELKDENRILVRMALKDMNNSSNTGIRALRRVCDIDNKPLSAYHLGFIIGPCINATGRLDSAALSLELLLCEDMQDALHKATELKLLNDLRKNMTEEGMNSAFDMIESGEYEDDKVLVIYLPGLHESLAGIVAGRVRERYFKPTLIITDGEEGLKGSGRSIPAYDMYSELSRVSDLFDKFGGHRMAAGISLQPDRLNELRQRINSNCILSEDELTEKVTIDVPMPLSYVSEEFISQLDILEPFGVGNPKPVFADKVIFRQIKTMGKSGDMARITASREDGGIFTLVLFGGLDKMKETIVQKYGAGTVETLFQSGYREESPVKMNVIYYPAVNEFRGNISLQFIVQDYN